MSRHEAPRENGEPISRLDLMEAIDKADRLFRVAEHLFATRKPVVHMVQTAFDHLATKPGQDSPPLPNTLS